MKLHLIIRSRDGMRYPKNTMACFEAAAQKHDIDIVVIESTKVDVTNPPQLAQDDLLYLIHHDQTSRGVETLLLKNNPATLYEDIEMGYYASENVWTWTMLHDRAGLPIIPTVFDLPRDKTALHRAVDELGGFPVVVKAEGGSHGVGVMIFDSMPSLASAADYLRTSQPGHHFVMRKYIDYTAHARIIVLGDKVIDSIEYKRQTDDFRSNTGDAPTVLAKTFPADVQQAAVTAVHKLKLEFGGVDMLIDKDGTAYIAEVNFPCNFSRSQITTGTDIAGMIIDHLVAKAKKAS